MKALFLALALISTPAFACPGNQICAGDRIIDSDDLVGTALAVFSNGKAKVTLDGYSGTHVRELDSMGKGVPCLARLCVRNRIIDSDQLPGTVLELFTNGKAKVTLDGYSGDHIRDASSLGKGKSCVRNICVGSRIIDGDDLVGTVVEIFNNREAKVTLDGYSGTHIRDVSTLARGYRCIGAVCVGNSVMDSDDLTGRVQALFANGKVQVTLDGYSGLHIRDYNSLGLKLSCRPGQDCLNCRD